MSAYEDLKVLSDAAYYDRCNSMNYNRDNILQNHENTCIYNSKGANNTEIPLFKTLLTNKCVNDCKYCINCRRNKNMQKSLTPEQLSSMFMKYYENSKVEGLFLSSAVAKNADLTMEELIHTAHILRNKYSYKGYIHLKIIPGASYDDIKLAMQLSDRVSINIESATKDGLNDLATTKDYDKDILRRLSWISKIRRRHPDFAPSGHTTQVIVGANEENDEQIISQTYKLKRKYHIENNYFSSFMPIEGTPLEDRKANNDVRTGRLYQTQNLFDSYKIGYDEIVFNDDGYLDLKYDPKYMIALENKHKYPIDINTAVYDDLIHIPGIGVKTAKTIIRMRQKGEKIKSMNQLKDMGANTNACKTFIKINKSYQSTLF